MSRRIFATLLVVCLAGSVGPRARADEEGAALPDEARLKAAGLATDGPGLLTFFRLRTKGEVSAEKLAELLEQLEDKAPARREKACAELVAIGPPAIPLLRQAARDADNPEVASLARRCLRALVGDSAGLTASAVRLLGQRRPAGTAEVVLAYLPHAENDRVLEQCRNVLMSVAYTKGAPDPALLKALEDEHPLRRAMAVVAVCSRGSAEPRATLRKLLNDKMPSVRLRASLALSKANDPKAVSTMIALLGDLSTEQAREVEAFLGDLAQEQAPNVPVGEDEVSRQRARDAWARWWLDTEGPGLLEEVKKRTLTEAMHKKALALIENLADDAFEVRQESEMELRKMGAVIKPLLKQALKHDDLEVRTRTAKCLALLEKEKAPPLSGVTARLIALRKPKGAVEVLLAYMPFQEDDEAVQEQVQKALNSVAYEGGKANPLLVKALADKNAYRRAGAAEALCHGPMGPNLATIRGLLKDKEPMVRLKVALALSSANEPDGVPVLAALIGEVSGELSIMAEEYLAKIAGDSAPKPLPEGEDGRKKRSTAWAKWWDDNKTRVVLLDRNAQTDREPFRNLTLLIQTNMQKIMEVDRSGKMRWEITGLLNPWDAFVLPGNRVLITEYSGMRVTERNFKGDVLWQKQFPNYPMYAERLKNGNTFVVFRNQLLEITRGGREVFKIDRPNDVMSARKLPNGQVVFVTNNRQVIRLDRNGKELKTFAISNVAYNSNEVLNNGHVLIPQGWNNRTEEYDATGKLVRAFTSVQQPVHAVRLPNGNTLVSSSQSFPAYKLFEVDRDGKIVHEMALTTYTSRARRR